MTISLISRLPLLSLFLLLALGLLSGCQRRPGPGSLLIHSEAEGVYEIYSIAGDSSLQFVSEQMGHFNQELLLNPGSYLILADCSHRTVIIHPGEQVQLSAHQVVFVPPHEPAPEDLFSVQCSRYEKSQLKQQINNRFVFNMISGSEDLLVSMKPLKVDFKEEGNGKESTGSLSFRLSALQVAPWGEETGEQPPYFVSPDQDLLSVTQPQVFGRWQFLLPGSYRVEVNGTEKQVILKEGESKAIHPAGLLVKTDESVDLSLYQQIRGHPFNIEVNSHHLFEINTLNPVLPGELSIRFDGSGRVHKLNMVEKVKTVRNMNSVLVDLGCTPWEWECLGKAEVNLYLPDNHYPFLESISDVPVLYNEKSIQIGLEGSKGLRYKISRKKRNTTLYVGKLKIIPKPIFKSGFLTDLSRLEAGSDVFSGFSHDIQPDRITVMPLIAGRYLLARYTNQVQENDRVVAKFPVRINPGETTEFELPYYLPETKARFSARLIRQELNKSAKRHAYVKKRNRHLRMF